MKNQFYPTYPGEPAPCKNSLGCILPQVRVEQYQAGPDIEIMGTQRPYQRPIRPIIYTIIADMNNQEHT